MANRCELVQGSSIAQAKVADWLGPKGVVAGGRSITCWSRGQVDRASTRGRHAARSICECLRSHILRKRNVETPYLARRHCSSIPSADLLESAGAVLERPEGKRAVRRAHGRAGVGCRNKRMPSCNGMDTGSRFARRESEQTSDWCLVARESVDPNIGRESKG